MSAATFELYNHQETHPTFLDTWQEQAERALPEILLAARSAETPLHHLKAIEISFVSDEIIGQIHGNFMDDPAPTDVITFLHGEILISLDTAVRQAVEHAESYEREVTRYMIHGLMHLAGWDDHNEADRTAMHQVQERILAGLPQSGGSAHA